MFQFIPLFPATGIDTPGPFLGEVDVTKALDLLSNLIGLRRLLKYYASVSPAPELSEWQYGLPTHLYDALEQGAMTSFCLSCGKALRSDRCIPLITNLFFFPLFYRFRCCHTYYVIHGCQPPSAVGVYLEEQDTVISFFNYSYPISRLDWGFERFEGVIHAFKKTKQELGEVLDAYLLAPEPARLTFCLGFNPNAGHQLREELGVYQKLLALPHGGEAADVIVGPHDYFEAASWIGKNARLRTLPIQSIHDTGNALMKEVLEKNLFLLRLGTHAHVPDALEHALMDWCVRRAGAHVETLKALVKPSFPCVWITLRSHSRVWVQQVDGLRLMMEAVLMEFPHACFLIDGLQREASTLKELSEHFSAPHRLINLIGSELLRSLSYFTCADMYVIPFSNANLMPMIVAKPGVLYGQRGWIPEGEALLVPRENPILGQHVVGWRVSMGDPLIDENPTRANYDVSLAELVESVLKVARRLPLRVAHHA